MATNIIEELAVGLPSDVPPSGGITGVNARAKAELFKWGGRTERNPDIQPYLASYWETVGLDDWEPSIPWSAAFVSYLMRPYGLPSEAAHWRYTQAVVDGKVPGWKAYAIVQPVKLAPGDILVRPRGVGVPEDDEYWWSHGDVVYQADRSGARWIGGNLSDRLKSGELATSDGKADLRGLYSILLRREKKNVAAVVIGGAALLWLIARNR